MRALKLLSTVLLGLTVLASAAVAALFLVDPSTYRNQIERQVSAALGKTFKVVGPIHLEKSLRPQILLDNVTIANPQWAVQPYFAAAKRVGVQVALMDLLRGELRILDLAFDGVTLSIEENPSGGNNYTFATGSNEQQAAMTPALEQLSITNSVITYRPAQGDGQSLQVDTVKLRNNPGTPQSIEGRGVFKGKDLTFSIVADSPASATETKPVWALEVNLTGPDMALAIASRVENISEWQRADYRVNLSGKKSGAVADLLGIELPTAGPFEVSARINKEETSIQVADIAANLRLRPHLPLIEIASGAVRIGNDEPVSVVLKGQFGDDPIKLDLTALSLTSGPSDTNAWAMTARLELADLKLFIKANEGLSRTAGRYAFDTELQGDNLAALARVIQTELPEVGPYRLSFHADIGPDRYTFKELKGSIERTGAWRRIAIVDGEVSGTDTGAVSAAIQTELDNTPVSLNVEGSLLPTGGPITKSWPFNLEAATTGATLNGKGSFVVGGKKPAVNLAARLRGSRIETLNSLFGTSVPPLQQFDLRANIGSDGTVHSIDDLDLQIGKNRFNGHALWDGEGPRPRLTLKLSTGQLRLGALLLPSAKTARGTSGNSVLDVPMPLDGLSEFDARAEIAVAQIVDGPIDVRQLKSTVTLADGHLDIPVHAKLLRNDAEFRIQLRKNKAVPTVSLSAKADNVDVGKIVQHLKLPTAVAGTADAIRLDASSTGSTLKDWVERARFELRAEPARLLHRTEIAGETFATEIKSVSIAATENRPVSGRLSARIEEKPVAVMFSTATLRAISRPTEALPVSLSVSTSDLQFDADGSVRRPLDSKAFDLSYELVGEEIERLGRLTDFAIPLRGEFRTQGRVEARGDQITLHDELRVGKSVLKAELALSLARTRPKLSGRIVAQQVHVDDVDIFDADKQGAADASGRVIPDYTLPVEALFGIDLDLVIKARRIEALTTSIGAVTSKIRLNDGRFASSLSVDGDHGARVNTEFSVNAKTNPPPVSVRVNAQGIDFGQLLDTLGASGLVRGQGEVHVAIDGTGASRYSILENAKGRITVIGGPGQIASRSVDLWAADLIPTMLSTSWQREDVTETNCMVAHFELKEGVAELENLLLDTRRMTVAGSGTMNLMTEALNLVFAPRPKRASLISLANPVRVKGTLSAPAVSVTRMPGLNRLTTGASLLAGLINPVFLAFALSDAGTGETNPCESAVDQTRKSAGVE